MSDSNDMTQKYQVHYNKILNSTLTDTILKSVSYQANIQLANEIIAEQEKTIVDLQNSLEVAKKEFETNMGSVKKELESFKAGKLNTENSRISFLENNVKTQLDTINRLNSELVNANKLKIELDNLKNQANNGDIFRKELVKERESHAATKSEYEQKVNELSEQLDLLKAPAKRKKPVKKSGVLELIGLEDTSDSTESVDSTDETVKDGGSF